MKLLLLLQVIAIAMIFALIFRKPKEDDEAADNDLEKDEITTATTVNGTLENRGKHADKTITRRIPPFGRKMYSTLGHVERV